ncbi:hypothetical protein BDZ94DRAFT_687734 [Collybia nuda]|uniref:Uncharacterized protein n=1 Tax=Collybia nuda TaxID=64659 RepID=A0A9P6CQH7_9AGAR|nr:hypothetical protein BDZ94DRAFT_687734 [Collybia nuda]
MTVIGINIVALMMLIRIYALYRDKLWAVKCVAPLLLVEVVVNGWLLTKGKPVLHVEGSGVHSCTMIFDTNMKALASSSAWLPLLYDTVATGLTLYRTMPSIREKNTMYITRSLLKDGLIYYSTILMVTLVLTFMIIFAPPGVQNIAAQ